MKVELLLPSETLLTRHLSDTLLKNMYCSNMEDFKVLLQNVLQHSSYICRINLDKPLLCGGDQLKRGGCVSSCSEPGGVYTLFRV